MLYFGFIVKGGIVELMLRSPEKLQKQVRTFKPFDSQE